MIADDIHKLLEARIKLDSHDANETEECWNAEVKVLTDDLQKTLHFFEFECSDEELFWLSEVFTSVSKILQSTDFINVLKRRLAMVTSDSYSQSNYNDDFINNNITYDDYVETITMEIDFAEGALNE